MSTDEQVTKSLIEILEDGKEGFAKGADKLADSDRPQFASVFREYSEQRARFSTELRSMAAGYGDDVNESGSVLGALHRGWMTLKDALSGDGAEGVLDAAEQGEDHAVEEYQKAMSADISDGLRTVVSRQFQEVKSAHDRVKSLRDSQTV